MVLKFYVGTKFRENGQKSRKSRNLIPAKFNTFKISSYLNSFSEQSSSEDIISGMAVSVRVHCCVTCLVCSFPRIEENANMNIEKECSHYWYL